MQLRFGICTFSDRAHSGERPDASGPALVASVEARGWIAAMQGVFPDDQSQISRILKEWVDGDQVDVILTTGGTGFAPRDVTPEATLSVIDREAPGLTEMMRATSAAKSPHAMLSRARAGIRGRVLIVNLPGSPKAAVENLEVVAPALEHAVMLLREDPAAEAGHREAIV